MQTAAGNLTAEKCANHDREGDPVPAQAGEDAKRNYKGDRNVHREEPRARKFPNISTPVAEGKINDENSGCNRQYIHKRYKRSDRLHDDTVFREGDLFQDALNAFFLAEEVPEDDGVSLDARLTHGVEHQLLPVFFSHIGFELTHTALPCFPGPLKDRIAKKPPTYLSTA